MINDSLAQYSTLAFVTAIAIYVLAFIGFTVDAARGSQVRSDRKLEAKQRERELVGAGAPVGVEDSKAAQSSSAEGGADASTQGDDAVPGGAAMTALRFAMTLTVAAAVVHLAGVVMRGVATGRVPWGNMYEFSMTGSAAVTIMFLGISAWNKDLRHLGAFIFGPMLLLMMVAQTAWYLPAAHLTPSLQNSYWLVIHVFVAIMSIALFTIAAVTSLLQLLTARREAKALAGDVTAEGRVHILDRLPGSKKLEQLSFQINAVGFVLWTFTLIAGSIWAKYAWGRYWGWDPKEVWTFVIWVVYAAYLHARATQGFRGSRAAYFALAGFGCIIINYTIVNTVINGLHSYSGL